MFLKCLSFSHVSIASNVITSLVESLLPPNTDRLSQFSLIILTSRSQKHKCNNIAKLQLYAQGKKMVFESV